MHYYFRLIYNTVLSCISLLLLLGSFTLVEGKTEQENASNPLSKGKNTDLRWQYTDSGSAHINNFFIDGAFMAHDKLKIKYELHYWETDITGNSENNLESVLLKGIYFPKEGVRGDLKYRLAFGADWSIDLGDQDKGIGSGSDMISPFGGIALGFKSGTSLIPLIQQFLNYNGNDINTTAFRLIAMQPLKWQMWLKLDAKVPIEWENDQAVPATTELQIGKNINKLLALYADGLVGLGGDRPYDWGIGAGVRFKY